jgi:hypothetical protein
MTVEIVVCAAAAMLTIISLLMAWGMDGHRYSRCVECDLWVMYPDYDLGCDSCGCKEFEIPEIQY